MRIGIISNSDSLIPLTYELVVQKLQVLVFYSPSKDHFVNQKVFDFFSKSKLQFIEEKNNKTDIYRWLDSEKFDACFIIGYSRLLEINKIRNLLPVIFNIHFGLLPVYKGPTPIFWQLKHGAPNIGITIHQLSGKFDDGPIVWKKEVSNSDYLNYETVNKYFSRLCIEGVFFILNLLIHRIPIIGKKDVQFKNASYYHKPTLDDVMIHWSSMSANEVCNLVRACNPWNKGAISLFKGQELKLLDATIINQSEKQGVAGEILDNEECLKICTSDNQILMVNMIFYSDCFIPAYYCKYYGFAKGDRIGV